MSASKPKKTKDKNVNMTELMGKETEKRKCPFFLRAAVRHSQMFYGKEYRCGKLSPQIRMARYNEQKDQGSNW
jgi:hypothetical protein